MKVPVKKDKETTDNVGDMGLDQQAPVPDIPMQNGEQPQPPVDGNIPPMPDDNGEGDMGEPNEFDSNFDAGVEADEESDPKKYIQQLTGKLSQKLNSYNKENNDPDLSKYVAGMIVSQAVKNLDDDDKNEVIDKIKNGDAEDDNMDSPDIPDMDDNGGEQPENMDEPPMNPEEQPQEEPKPQPQNNFESIKSSKETIDEILDSILSKKEDDTKMNPYDNKKNYRKSYKVKPFIAKKFQ